MTNPNVAATLEHHGKLSWVRARIAVTFSSLAYPNFRYLWLGQLGSATAMHADMLARSWLVWQLTGSFTAVAAVNVARGVPMLIFGLLGGVVADRFDRRKILIVIQTWTLIMHAAMAAIVISGVVELWHVYGLALLLGISQSMNQPIRTSIIPQLVDKSRMLNAITLHSIAINGTRFIGPAAIAFVIGFAGVGSAYVVSAAVYVVVIWSTTKIQIPDAPGRASEGNVLSQLADGFRFILSNRLIVTLVVLGLGPLALGIAHRSLLPGLVTNVLNADVEFLGVLQSAAAVGSLAAGLYLASRVDIPNKGMLMLAVTAIYGLSLMAVGGATVLWMVMPLLIAGSMSQTVFRAANTTLLLEKTPAELRGRVMSITLIDNALSPVFGIAAGLIADSWGVGAGFLFIGSAILGVVAIAFAMNPAIRRA